jgi:elongation factor G
MFGYATEIRGSTSGQGEFSLEYRRHEPVSPNEFDELVVKF